MVQQAPLTQHDDITEASLRREHLTGRINLLNPTANVEWLGRFDDLSLRDYLDRLERLAGHRGPTTRWERRGGTPAIDGREPYDAGL